MSLFVAVDTGGTFTDLVALDSRSKRVFYTKSLTTHDDAIEGVRACLTKADVCLSDATMFKHGTTLVINTLLERSGPDVAIVTTAGFRDVVELGRGSRTEPFELAFDRAQALVPRHLRFEVAERTTAAGKVQLAPSRTDVEALADAISALGAAAVAVSFVNAYRNPENEQLTAAWLRSLLPGVYITCGSDLSREWYEYERSVTASANAYVGPKIGTYVGRLDTALRESGFGGDLFLMNSSGGLLSAQSAATTPVLLVESGPVGGCIGARELATHLALNKVIAFDMGGTTAKCALIEGGQFGTVSPYHVGGYGRGLPLQSAVIDIVEVGAGGGSVAWTDRQQRLHVGPRSAGSVPGPVAYGRGGTEPTVTDANLLLHRLNAANFQGGEMHLDLAAAHAAVEGLAEQFGHSGEEAVRWLAQGIITIANTKMTEAIKRITVERGKDPGAYQ